MPGFRPAKCGSCRTSGEVEGQLDESGLRAETWAGTWAGPEVGASAWTRFEAEAPGSPGSGVG